MFTSKYKEEDDTSVIILERHPKTNSEECLTNNQGHVVSQPPDEIFFTFCEDEMLPFSDYRTAACTFNMLINLNIFLVYFNTLRYFNFRMYGNKQKVNFICVW
jgi:hypothetical protein